jgi:hypothetical protein
LDVFFNGKPIYFGEDYNKARLAEVRQTSKGKQFIDIRITFSPPKGYSTLPKLVTITKSWDRNGDLIGAPNDDLESQVKLGKFTPSNLKVSKRSLATLLKKIRYKHIPGVRDESFFMNLLQELQIALFEKEDRRKSTENSVKDTISSFNDYIIQITKELNDDFYNTSKIQTNLSFPSELTLLFKRLLVDTKAEGYDIPLYLRDDGIRLWYIPAILNHIAQISPKIFIWGFDGPENSCEYSLTDKLANDFLNKYTKNAQIFVSTHSFAFISIKNKNCTSYRIFKDKDSILNSKALCFNKIKKHENKLLDELGIIDINSKLKSVFDEFNAELKKIKAIENELKEHQRPFLIFEGESDKIHFSSAYQILNDRSIDDDYKLCDHLKSDNGSSIGDGAPHLNHFLYNYIGEIDTANPIIGIFDFDEEGVSQIKGLKKIYDNISDTFGGNIVFRHRQKHNVYAIVLVPPDFRSKFVDFQKQVYSYLSKELLFQDSDIATSNRKYPTKYDRTVFSFKGNKHTFAERITANLTDHNFNGFKPTIDLIKNIIKKTENI